MSLKSRLAILFFVISFLPSIAIGIVNYNNYASLFEKNKFQSLDYIADYKVKEIELYFSALVDDIKSTQSSWCIRENLPLIIKFCQDQSDPKFISAKKILDERFQPTQKTWGLLDIMLTDTEGRVVYGTSSEHIHRLGFMADPGQKAFKEGLKGVYISDTFLDPAEGYRPKVLISAPDFNYDGSLLGVIIFEVGLSRAYDIVKDSTGLGDTGEALLAIKDDGGIVYMNPLKYGLEKPLTKHIKLGGDYGLPAQNAVQGRNGHGRSIDYRGIKTIAAWRYIPSVRWGLVTKIDAHEAFREIEILKYILFGAIGLLFILCLFVSRLIAWTIAGSREKLNKEIDERKKAAKELEEYKDRLEDLVNERTSEISNLNRNIEFVLGATKTGLDIIDHNYNMIYIDPEWQKVYGDPKGKKCYEYFMGRDTACPVCGLKEAFETKKPVVTEEILAKEGNRPIQVTTIPYQDKDGRWLVAEVNVDITNRKQIENTLINSEQKLRNITNAIPSVVYTYQMSDDGGQKFLFLSDMVGSVFGISKEEALADFNRLWNLTLPEERGGLYKSILTAYREFKHWQYEWRIKTNDGKIKWIRGESIPEPVKIGGNVVWNGTLSDITERKKIALELERYRTDLENLVKERTEDVRRSEERLQFALEASFTGAWDMNMADRTIVRSIEYDRIFGYTEPAPSWTYEIFLSHILPDDREKVDQVFRYALEHNTKWDFECRIRRADGIERWIWSVGQIKKDIFGKAQHMIGIMQDITEQKKTQSALRESDIRIRNLNDNIIAGMVYQVIRHKNGVRKFTYLSDSVRKLYGCSPEEGVIDSNCIYGKIHPEDRDRVMREEEDANKKLSPFRTEARILLPSGDVRWSYFASTPRQLEDGNTCWDGIEFDITDRKNFELALESSEANYRAIFESASDAIIISDIESYTIIDANEQACELLCYPKEELLNTTPEKILPREAPHNWKNMKSIFDKASSGEPQQVELLLQDKAERTFWVEAHIKRAIVGGTYRLLSILHDISERKESEKNISELNKSIAQANEELKKLALIDAHTGLYNYHYYSGVIESEFARAQRQDGKLSLIMMDIDYFKSINDVYGHQFGDLILKQFAELLKKTVRLYDTVIRFGGEEFIIIAPGTGNEEALKLAKRILSAVGSCPFGNDEHKVKLKVSAACGSYPDDSRIKSTSDFINISDMILSKAKEEGGNRAYSLLDYGASETSRLKEKEPDIASLKDKIVKLTTRGNQSVAEAIFAFAKTIELKDKYTGAHVDDTMHYAVAIADKLGLADNEVELIKYAAALHDLGKVGIPEAILHKTGKLTEEEFNIIKLHPQIGADIIRPIHFLHDIIPAILHHHEHWDGSGYPTGLKKESIPLASRIVAIADAYQAMTSDRPYRKALELEKAAEELKKNSGTQFDPKIVSIFLSLLKTEKKYSKYRKNP